MWNVFAADLQNEPHAASWGFGRSVDWDRAAGRLGNHVLRGCPRWLVMVEGVGYKPGAPGEYTLGFESPPTRGGARGGGGGAPRLVLHQGRNRAGAPATNVQEAMVLRGRARFESRPLVRG